MSSLFGMLEVSKRALSVGQMGVQVANHNIANLGTPGYVRQRVQLGTMSQLSGVFGRIGAGVEVQQIQRVTDRFLANAYRAESTEYNEWRQAGDILGQVEIITNIDEESSLSAAMSEFFDAFGDLAQNGEDSALRQIVVNKASLMTNRFRSMAADVDGLYADTNARIASQVGNINELVGQIAGLNEQIIASETGSAPANDLRTERERLVAELSTHVSIDVSENASGAVDVYINGKNVVHRATAQQFTDIVVTGERGDQRFVELNGVRISGEDLGGSLGAAIETRDSELASVREAIDTLAAAVIEQVNQLHRQGESPQGSGVDFFSGTSAIDIDVSQLLQEDAGYVATSYNGTSGDNALANDIANMIDQQQGSLGDKSFVGFFADLVGGVGSLAENAEIMAGGKKLAADQVLARIESVSGVSLDEELANITQYQTAYEAAASVVSTITEMIDTILVMGAR